MAAKLNVLKLGPALIRGTTFLHLIVQLYWLQEEGPCTNALILPVPYADKHIAKPA